MADLRVARSELILGGEKSGKTARAEMLAAAWLAQSPGHRAVYIATAQAWDEEMRERIDRHSRQRADAVPRMATVQEPVELAHAIGRHSRSDTLIVVDCLTLWLTARLMPAVGEGAPLARGEDPESNSLSPPERAGVRATHGLIAAALRAAAGPLVLISNEIGGAMPLGQDVRAFLETLGGLNQESAAACERVTLMSAGQPLILKGAS